MTPESEELHAAGIASWRAGDALRARELLQAAIKLAPDVAAYHLHLGVILRDLDFLDERIECYRRAVQLEPSDAVSHTNLAAALSSKGKHAEAETEARTALQLTPDRSESWFSLGSALSGQQRWIDAADAYDKAALHRPDWHAARLAAAQAYRQSGQLDVAAQRFERLLALSENGKEPDYIAGNPIANLWHALGEIYAALRKYAAAEASFRAALQRRPDDPASLTDLGNALHAQGKIDAAEACYQRVAQVAPDLPASYCNLGTVAQARGAYEEAIRYYRSALQRDSSLAPIWDNLGNCLTYSPLHGPNDVLEAFSEFNRFIAEPLIDTRPHSNLRQPDRPLRVGYLSPDFRKHAVAYFALPLIEGHHPDQVEVVCYYNHRQQDEWTARFKAAAKHWVDCVNLDDAALAERIRGDGIDILVDLAGHTEGNRLLVFARKPAPVQATWLGYVTTTGLTSIDYRLTHADADPSGTDKYYSEKLWRLPGTMWCYRPLPNMPEVTSPPFRRKGFITFGSFNRFSKISPRVLESWARILSQVPGSHLMMCLPKGEVRQEVAAFFAKRGVAPERISAYDKVPHARFWALHGEVDIALDPYPFNGGTTSCETLWLGVPIVSCTGADPDISPEDSILGNSNSTFSARFSSRMGYAFLNSLGLPELAAKNESDYIKLAVTLAQDSRRLEELRRTLRERMANAPLTDERRFVRDVEAAYRHMWQEWCACQANSLTSACSQVDE